MGLALSNRSNRPFASEVCTQVLVLPEFLPNVQGPDDVDVFFVQGFLLERNPRL